jgi:excisionase family DNA binding protein
MVQLFRPHAMTRPSIDPRISSCRQGTQMKRKTTAKTSREAVPSKVMTVREVSAYLHVHPSTIYKLLKQRQIPAFQMGSDWRFHVEAIDRWCLQKQNRRE